MGDDQGLVSKKIQCHKELTPIMSQLIMPEFHYFEVLPLEADSYFESWLVAVALDEGCELSPVREGSN